MLRTLILTLLLSLSLSPAIASDSLGTALKSFNSQIKKSPAKKTVPQKSPKKTVAKPSAQNLSTLLKNKQAKLLKDNSAIPAPKKTSETTNQPKETGKSLEVVKKI